MCGIVGFTGKQQAVPVLLQGLTTLEYRGYDSAGVTLQTAKGIETIKTQGRISVLEEKINSLGQFDATCGIGHTRWATHGAPSDRNSHPHESMDGRIALVHNGIIENYLELRNQLIAEGVVFKSDTDSEVVAHLFAKFYEFTFNFRERKLRFLKIAEHKHREVALNYRLAYIFDVYVHICKRS